MRPSVRLVVPVLAAALAASCGPSESELARDAALEQARVAREAAARADSRWRAAEASIASARAETNAVRAQIADAEAKARAEAKASAAKLEKEVEQLTAHRDELLEWIEKELLPVAEQHQPELANLRQATETMGEAVARIRGLPWKHPVMRRRIRRAQMGEWMQRDLRKELTPEKAKEMVTVGAEMGLVAPDTDIYAIFTEFMEAGVAAFYRPDTRTFYHIEGNDGRGAYPIVFHELVHALEDQHFDLDAFYKAVEKDSDGALARRGLVEGSAAYYQDRYQAENPGDVAEMMRSQATPDMVQRQMKMVQKVPAFLVASMGLYPYNNGKVWVNRMTGGDPAKVAALFADPPVSTEQVLHPEKFADPAARDWPRRVDAPDLSGALPGWKTLDPDNMGELMIGCLVAQLRAKGIAAFLSVMDLGTQGFGLKEPMRTAVAGWDGDRYVAAIDPASGRATVAWTTVWDTEADAQEFLDLYAAAMGKKLTGAEPKPLPDPIRFEEKDTGRVTRIVREGRVVAAAIGCPPDRAEAVLAAALAARITADPRDANDR